MKDCPNALLLAAGATTAAFATAAAAQFGPLTTAWLVAFVALLCAWAFGNVTGYAAGIWKAKQIDEELSRDIAKAYIIAALDVLAKNQSYPMLENEEYREALIAEFLPDFTKAVNEILGPKKTP